MRLLLDTHTVLWFFAGDVRLAPRAASLIEETGNSCAVSLATPWEMAIKISLGKLRTPYTAGSGLAALLMRNGMDVLPPEAADFDLLTTLPFHHHDPFDRLLAAQALRADFTLISADPVFDRYGVRRIWARA
jgi:PIN domain nuclease of toxin-antitoxin system